MEGYRPDPRLSMESSEAAAEELLRAAERSAEAAIAFAAAFALQPSEAIYVNGLGTALQGGGRGAEATSAYLTAVRLKPVPKKAPS